VSASPRLGAVAACAIGAATSMKSTAGAYFILSRNIFIIIIGFIPKLGRINLFIYLTLYHGIVGDGYGVVFLKNTQVPVNSVSTKIIA
jgi:hypothetical protein